MCSDGGVSLNSFVATTLSGTRPTGLLQEWFL